MLLPAHGAIPELADGGTYATGQANRKAQPSVRGAACPPQWLAVLVLTAAASPSPPPSRMPPPPSPPSPYVFKSSFGLKAAAQEFDNDTAAAIARYGPIADWDVSAISNMGAIFYNLSNFNADISSWDTSSVTHMSAMFLAARAFNQPLSFDTSRVTAMAGMFQVSLSTVCCCALAHLQPRSSSFAGRICIRPVAGP